MYVIFSDWLIAKDEPLEFEGLLPERPEALASLLRRFYAEVRQRNGTKYGTSAMRNIRQAIQRHLQEPPHNKSISIISDPTFKQANSMLDTQIRKLREEGLDEAKHKDSIEPEDMVKLNSRMVLNNPVGLQEAFFVDFMVHFGRRGREGLRLLKKDCFVFKKTAPSAEYPQGRVYAELRHNVITKCDDGTSKKQAVSKEMAKKMWQERTGRCPIATVEQYLSKLNPACPTLFQRPNHKFVTNTDRWYDNMVLGVKTLGSMMKTISTKYELSQTYTNHCLRASVVTELERAGFAPTDICHATGHKSAESLKHYCDRPSTSKSEKMSSALHAYLSGGVPSTSTPIAMNAVPRMSTTNPVPSTSRAIDTNAVPSRSTIVSNPVPGTSTSVQPDRPTVPDVMAGGDGPEQQLNINMPNNFVQWGQDMAKGILAGAVFHGTVNINFNISKE